MEQNYLIDTNVVIDFFGNKLPQNGIILLKSITPTVSAVTQIEVLGWINPTKEQLQPLTDFMDIATILPINEATIQQTIQLRQQLKIPLGDAIIAATALVHNLTIITRNTKDFTRIENVKTIDPHSL